MSDEKKTPKGYCLIGPQRPITEPSLEIVDLLESFSSIGAVLMVHLRDHPEKPITARTGLRINCPCDHPHALVDILRSLSFRAVQALEMLRTVTMEGEVEPQRVERESGSPAPDKPPSVTPHTMRLLCTEPQCQQPAVMDVVLQGEDEVERTHSLCTGHWQELLERWR